MNDSFIVVVINNETGNVVAIPQWEVEGCSSDKDLYFRAAAVIAEVVEGIGSGDITVHVRLFNA